MQSTQPKKKVKLNKFEKLKAEKDGLDIKDQLEHFAEIGWQAMDKSDLELRLKWVGIFHRPVTPGKFMLRLRMPNGLLTSEQKCPNLTARREKLGFKTFNAIDVGRNFMPAIQSDKSISHWILPPDKTYN